MGLVVFNVKKVGACHISKKKFNLVIFGDG